MDITKDKKTTKEGPSTPCNMPLALVIQMFYIMTMPYHGTPGTPFFEGVNITDFLNWYKLICTDFQVEEKEKILRLSQYCEIFIG